MDNQVALYIYKAIPENITANVVNTIESSIVADGGTFEAESCLVDTLNSLGGYFGTSQKSYRVELFNDEKISVTSSLQNLNDIGKVFTDFSQSFTIPANDYNNSLFSHWYESDVDNGYDHRVRYNAYIEINTITFREGNIQLEKANRKNGYIESYSVTFYGNLTQLKDLFKEDKLNQLDYSIFNHPWTSTEIINRIITSTPDSIMYPLLGNTRKFQYETGSVNEDITLTGGAIEWNNLFPAIRLSDIFNRIQLKYKITFTGSFLNSTQWKKLRVLLKNDKEVNYYTPPTKINFNTAIITIPSPTTLTFDDFDLTSDTLNFDWDFTNLGAVITNQYHARRIICPILIYPTVNNIPYKLLVYDDGVLWQTFENLIGDEEIYFYDNSFFNDPINHKFTFYIQSQSQMTFTSYFDYDKRWTASGNNYIVRGVASQQLVAQVTTADSNIQSFVPDITVSDFFTGVFKMFNLMIIPNSATEFELIPLELFYQQGQIVDLTKYVKSDNFDIERPKLFKTIKFEYEKSSNILNDAFYGLFNLQYGDLIYTNQKSNESANYEIKVPFEDVLFEKQIGEEAPFLTATFIDKDLNPYTPKPVFIYENGLLETPLTGTHRIRMTTEASQTIIDNYNRFSNEIAMVGSDLSYLMSTNWGAYQSPYYNIVASGSLYQRHYRNYIDNLYNIKTRLYKIKAILPELILNSLTLKDRIIIRDKRFIINSFTTDLTTGETDFDLITDYREVDNQNTIGYRYSTSDVVILDNTAQSYEITIYRNEFDSFNVGGVKTFASFSDELDNTSDLTFTITIAPNATGLERLQLIDVDYYKDGVSQRINLSITQLP
jgi:hypothetical protein